MRIGLCNTEQRRSNSIKKRIDKLIPAQSPGICLLLLLCFSSEYTLNFQFSLSVSVVVSPSTF